MAAQRLPMLTGPVRGSQSGKPIMALLDLIGRRWTLRILWELREQPLKARALRSRCDDASPSSLNARLMDLRQAGLVTLEKGTGYCLTDQGIDFIKVFLPIYFFAERWATRERN